MTRPEQIDLIDMTPLGLWSPPEGQEEAPTAPVAVEPTPARKLTIQQLQHNGQCLKCGKPSFSMFCTKAHKEAWQSSMSAWHNRLPKGPAAGEQTLIENP